MNGNTSGWTSRATAGRRATGLDASQVTEISSTEAGLDAHNVLLKQGICARRPRFEPTAVRGAGGADAFPGGSITSQ
jgi:hypothetical protein